MSLMTISMSRASMESLLNKRKSRRKKKTKSRTTMLSASIRSKRRPSLLKRTRRKLPVTSHLVANLVSVIEVQRGTL